MQPNPDIAAKLQALKRVSRKATPSGNTPSPKSPIEIVTDSENVLRPGLDFLSDLAVVTVAVETRQDSTMQWTPLVVTSNREMALVESNAVKIGGRELVFSSRPLAMPSLARWRYQDIQSFCSGEPVDAAKLFERILALHSRYLDYPGDGIAETLALWTVGTYFYALFPAYPYVELNAPRGSGKSKQMNLTARLAFNGRIIGAPSEASTFRLIEDTRGAICFDEAETFDKEQKAALLQILNMGYTASGTVARCEERTHTVREFHVYCPKMFASIRGIDSTTATRCIRVQFLRTTDKERGDSAITEDGEMWTELRHGLYSLVLTEFQSIREIYRLPEVRPFANRENEKWSPVLTLARFFEQRGVSGLVDAVMQFAQSVVAQSVESGLSPFDDVVLRTLHTLTEDALAVEVTPKDVIEAVHHNSNEWQDWKSQAAGYSLKRLGFKRDASRRKGSRYHVTKSQVIDVAARYDVQLTDGQEAIEQPATPATKPAENGTAERRQRAVDLGINEAAEHFTGRLCSER